MPDTLFWSFLNDIILIRMSWRSLISLIWIWVGLRLWYFVFKFWIILVFSIQCSVEQKKSFILFPLIESLRRDSINGNKIKLFFCSTLHWMEKTKMIQNLNTKYHSLNPTQIQIRLIRDLQDIRIRMMSLRNDQNKVSGNLIS